MIPVDARALPLLLDAADRELRRLETIDSTLDGSGDDWPPGFDSNDIPIYHLVVRALREAIRAQSSTFDLGGKLLWFLLDLVPPYIEANRERISLEQYEALKAVYSNQLERRRVPFPTFHE